MSGAVKKCARTVSTKAKKASKMMKAVTKIHTKAKQFIGRLKGPSRRVKWNKYVWNTYCSFAINFVIGSVRYTFGH